MRKCIPDKNNLVLVSGSVLSFLEAQLDFEAGFSCSSAITSSCAWVPANPNHWLQEGNFPTSHLQCRVAWGNENGENCCFSISPWCLLAKDTLAVLMLCEYCQTPDDVSGTRFKQFSSRKAPQTWKQWFLCGCLVLCSYWHKIIWRTTLPTLAEGEEQP